MNKLTALSAALALGLGTSTAFGALSVESLFKDGLLQWIDDDAEALLETGTPTGAADDGFLTTGDTLYGVLEITTIRTFADGLEDTLIGDGTAYNELTGIFATEVQSFTVTADPDNSYAGPDGIIGTADDTLVLNGDEFANYVFGASSSMESIFGLSAGSLTSGTMIAFYEDAAQNFAIDLSDTTTASDGTLRMELGLPGTDSDEQWFSVNGSVNPNGGFVLNFGTALATFNVDLTILNETFGGDWLQTNATDPALLGGAPLGDGLIDVHFQGEAAAFNQFGEGYPLQTQTTFNLNYIPEPGLLALMGMGLLSFGAFRRKAKA